MSDNTIMACVTALVVVLIVAFSYIAYEQHVRCTDNGGHWEKVNCREVEDQWCTTTDYGNNMVITSCFPTTSTVCDTVCVGARAEASK